MAMSPQIVGTAFLYPGITPSEKDRGQDDSDCDHGPETSSIAFSVAALGDIPFRYVFHRLDHDNGIVDDQADGSTRQTRKVY